MVDQYAGYTIEYSTLGYDEGDNSREILHSFLDSPVRYGITLDIKPASPTSHRWGLPHESVFKFEQFGDDPTRKYAVTPATIATEDWVEFIHQVHGGHGDVEENATQSTADWVVEEMENGNPNSIYTPVLSLDEEGNPDYAEGRSRGVGALLDGMDRIPIWIVVKEYA